jgi:hypothetical protein
MENVIFQDLTLKALKQVVKEESLVEICGEFLLRLALNMQTR